MPTSAATTSHNTVPPIELELRQGRRVLLLRRGFDATLLHHVLAVLEGVA